MAFFLRCCAPLVFEGQRRDLWKTMHHLRERLPLLVQCHNTRMAAVTFSVVLRNNSCLCFTAVGRGRF